MASYKSNVTGFSGRGTSAQNCNINSTGVKYDIHTVRIYNGQQSTFESRPIWFDVREPVKNFTGRVKDLEDLHDELQEGSRQVVISQITTISGLGGIGKSELARKYAYNYKKYYDGNVIWINAETQESIKNAFHRLASKELRIPITYKKDEKEQERDIKSIIGDVYRYFRGRKSLFIFDNVEEFESIKEILPSYSHLHPDENKPHVLITSRNREWDVGEEGEIKVMELGVLQPEEAVQFIRKALENIIDNFVEKEISQLAEKLQYFPLALRQATSYIKERNTKSKLRESKNFKINDYLEEYDKKAESLLDFNCTYSSDRYAKTTFITWRVTLENIRQKVCGQEAMSVLSIMAYLAPDEIHIEKLFSKLIKDEDKLYSAVELLNQYSMINMEKGVANIHRLVQLVIRTWSSQQNEEEAILSKALGLINRDTEERNYTHIITVWDYASKYGTLIDQYNHFTKYGRQKETLMHLLAKNGCYKAIESILTYLKENKQVFIVIDTPDKWGLTPLHRAAGGGHLDIVKYLVENGADFNASYIKCSTPLHRAAEEGHLDVVKYLVEKGADFNASNSYGWTPLHGAAKWGHLDIVKYLVENGADFNASYIKCSTPLHRAAEEGHLDVVKYLVEKGADFNASDSFGWTPLDSATSRGDVDVVKYLVEKDADFNASNGDGLTPLHRAAGGGHLDVVKYLVEKGADFNASNSYGWTPLHGAAKWGHLDLVKYLVEKGADFNASNGNGWTLLHMAAEWGHLDVVKYLVEKGADFNASNGDGLTPLHRAAGGGHLDVVKYLVEKGADFNTSDINGWTPSHSSTSRGDVDVVKYLAEKGADFNASNSNGWTP